MPDRTQEIKNLRQVFTASVNYTDEKIKKVYYDIGHNDISTEDHTNELAYQITAPAGAKLLQLQAIGGNTVKLSPSVASDSTKAMIKTMPSTVYTFDGSKFYGDSKVSENLAYIKNKSQTHSDIAYVASETQQTLTLNGTSSAGSYQNFEMDIIPSGTYYVSVLLSGTASASCNLYLMDESNIGTPIGRTDASLTNQQVTFTTNQKYLRINVASADIVFTNLTIRIMVSKTSITEYKKGFEGIHNLELSGLVVKNSDDEVMQTKTIDLTTIVDSNNNKLFPNGKLMGNTNTKDVVGVYSQQSKWIEYTFTGNESWTKSGVETNNSYYCNVDSLVFANTTATPTNVTWDNTIPNLVHTKYSATSGNLLLNTDLANVITLVNRTNGLQIRFGAGLSNDLTPEQVAQLFANTTLQYERATPLTSNTDLSATLRNIQGYPNGSIIAENTNNMDVESVITYNSIIQETLCSSVTVEGFNVWNEEWGNYHWVNGIRTTYATGVGCKNPISVKTGETYYFKRPSGVNAGYVYLDSNENLVGNGEQYLISGNNTLTIPSGVSYLCFWLNNYGAIYNHDICINISNAELNGTYKPHKDTITRNLPTITSDGWSAGTQRNYRVFCDDEGNAVNKRYTNVDKDDLGNYNYTYESSWGAGADFYINSVDTPTMKKPSDNDTSANVMSPNYTNVSRNTMYNNSTDMVMSLLTGGAFKFRNNLYDNATIFKTAMTNEPLYFEYDDASKTETDMDDFDFFFDVEEGDVITFNNTYAQQVYATYSFLIKEAKSNE